MYRSNLSLMAWFYAFFLFANSTIGVAAGFIRRQLGIGHNSAYRLCRMVRVHMALMARPSLLGQDGKPVHIDEVYLRHIKSNGKGKHDAIIVLGLACNGLVISGIVPDRRSETLLPQIIQRVAPGSAIVTDTLSSYKKLAENGFMHKKINHSIAFHDFLGTTNNEIEAYWSSVRRIFKARRQVSRIHAWTFIAEIEFLYNRRHRKDTIFEELISNFPSYEVADLKVFEGRFDWSS